MLMTRFVVWMVSVGMAVLGAGVVSGQNYPNKPVRIVTTAVGGGNDLILRLIEPALTVSLGQRVIIDNRRSGVIPGEILANAPPDGYTLLLQGNFWISSLIEKAPFDPVRDFAPITLAVTSPSILVVHPSLPVKSVKELIALAKAKPGKLDYASSGTGSAAHLAAELFKSMAGVNIVRIGYSGAGPAINAMISGETPVMFPTAAAGLPHVKSGRLRALAVTSVQPSALAPGLPSVAASGVPGYESIALYGIFAPAKTPAAIIDQLQQQIVQVLNKAEVKERLFNAGVETVGSSPGELATTMKSEIARMGKVIKDAGIRE